jgi:hypothetical protein
MTLVLFCAVWLGLSVLLAMLWIVVGRWLRGGESAA